MNRLKALYDSWGIPCAGTQVYSPRYREEWLNRIRQAGVRRRAELFYQHLEGLQVSRRQVRGEFLAESRKHKAVKVLSQIPCVGPIRAALLLALMQTPHRFRSKRQLWLTLWKKGARPTPLGWLYQKLWVSKCSFWRGGFDAKHLKAQAA
jgi:hypothetical protein